MPARSSCFATARPTRSPCPADRRQQLVDEPGIRAILPGVSRETVEIVRRAYEDGWYDREPQRLFAYMHEDAEFINPPEAVDAGVRRGLEDIAKAVLNMQSGFDESRHELRRVHGADDVLVAEVTFFARSRGSRIDIAQTEAHTWTFREGKIARFEWGRDLEVALAAAGLPATEPLA